MEDSVLTLHVNTHNVARIDIFRLKMLMTYVPITYHVLNILFTKTKKLLIILKFPSVLGIFYLFLFLHTVHKTIKKNFPDTYSN